MAQPGHTDDPVADAAEPAEPAQPVEPAVALWGLDPLFSAHAMLLACMVQQLRPSQRVPGVFFLKAHPMQRVHIVGHIVSVSARQKFVQYLGELAHLMECRLLSFLFSKQQSIPHFAA